METKKTNKVVVGKDDTSKKVEVKKVLTPENISVLMRLLNSTVNLFKLRNAQGKKLTGDQIVMYLSTLVLGVYIVVNGSIGVVVDSRIFDQAVITQDSIFNVKIDSLNEVNSRAIDSLNAKIDAFGTFDEKGNLVLGGK